MPTFREAAIIVLKEANKPLRVGEITRICLKKGIISTSGKTPIYTMHSQIYRDIKKNKKNSTFIKVGNGYYFLNSNINKTFNKNQLKTLFLNLLVKKVNCK